MDEIDSIGSARMESGSGNGDSEVQQTMLKLLNQLDSFEASNKTKVLMPSNRIDIMDQALLRPGRIDRKIEFPNPNEESRIDILKIHSKEMNLMRGIDLKKIVEKMNGASSAELKVATQSPDWSGLHYYEGCYLAHQWLAIVDLVSVNNEDKTVVVTVDEIFYRNIGLAS